jgi:PAS domain S-box-containing protein
MTSPSDAGLAKRLKTFVSTAAVLSIVFGVLGWLFSKPLLSGVDVTWAEVTVLAIVTGSMIAGFVGWTTFMVDRSDRERKRLEEALQLHQEHQDRSVNAVEEPETEARLRRLVKAGVAGAVLLTGLLGLLSWRMAVQAAEDADWVAHAHDVSATLELTLRHLVDVETGARGFALTGHEPFLEPYNSGKYAVGLDLQALRTLVMESHQVRRLDVLAKQAKIRIEEAADLVAARRQSGGTPSIARLMQSKQAMDVVRSTVQEMEDQERLLLERRIQRARSTRRFTSSAIGLGSILGIIFLFIAGLTVNREIRVAAKAQTEVKVLNANLERRVEQRTVALQSEVAVRKRTEEIHERLAAIVDSSDDAIISKTLDGTISAWNRGAEKIFGYSAAEIVGKTMLVLLPPGRNDEESDLLARIRRGESVEHFETVRVRKDGRNIDVSVTISPIRDANGAIVGASKVARDITERKRAEESLREKEHRLSESQRIAHIGSWTLDPNDPIGQLVWSDEMYRMYGVSRDTFAPTVVELLKRIIPEDRSAIQKWIAACAAGERPGDVEFRLRLPDGTIRVFSRRGELQYDSDNKPVRMVGTSQDITERRQTESSLRESEERFQVMANGIQQLAWMADADGSIFWYNQRWYDYTGTTLEQARGWTWEKIHDPAFLPSVLDRWRKSIADGTPFDMEFPLRGADGHFHMFLTRVMPVRNPEGRVVRWLGTNTDISERKKSEEQLARSAVEGAQQAEDLAVSRGELEAQTSMLKLVLESMGEGLIAADREGHFLLWNDAANKLMGRGAIDLPTKQWTPHYKVFLADGITPCPPDRLPLVRALYGESVKVELMVQPPEPEPGKFIEVTARPLNDARGNLRGGVAVLHDITERKRSEADLAQQAEELRHSQQALKTQTFMLQSVLDSMVEGLVAADEHGKFILWNPAADKIMGLGPTNLPSEEWSAHYGLFLPDTVTPIPPGETPLERTLRGDGGTTEIFLRQAGLNQGLWLEATGSPLIDKDGVMRGGVLAFRDITRRKTDELEIRKLNDELEERIAKRTEQLEATNDELEAFSYSVSHDLRTPLRHIASFARILVNDFGPAMAVEAREHLQRIEEAVRRMGLLVDALLRMAVLRRRPLRLSHSELNPIVDDVVTMLHGECNGRDVEWRIAKLPALDCDPILMAQVFQNLLGNALKYSRGRAKAVIEVDSIQQPDKPAIIFVRDNGAGFNLQYAEKLFGVFQRFHTDAEFEGTGVGLATVHRIIQKHGGMIWAEAEPDHGATFYFALQMTEQIGTTPKATAAS